MHLFNALRQTLFVAVAGTVVLSSCKRDPDVTPSTAATTTPTTSTSTSTNQTVNDWILGNMSYYYYWNDKIPANPDKTLSPDQFFDSILYKYNATSNPNGDRFSWIQQSADELKASLSGESKTTGMEFKLYLRSSGSTDVIGSVLYVYPGSPADKAGIKRGDVFSKVNGTGLTTTNYSTLLYGDGDTKTYTLAEVQSTGIVDTNNTKSVTAVVLQEDPVFMDSVYTFGAKKIGYVVYNQFVPGPNGSSVATYDQKLDAIFGKFKAKGVNELILDFRYNPGGYVSSATALGGLIAKGIGTKSVFVRKEWNSTVTPALEKQYGTDFFYDYLTQKANNIGDNLSQVYVLTTSGTASASELVINGLRPYFGQKVYTIGTTSYGKNVGSITISDNTGKIKWGMQPIVSKSFNKDNESNYSTGFVPKVEVREPLNMRPLGDVTERMLSEAIFQISGTRTARRGADESTIRTVIGSSIERKAGGSNMFFTVDKALPAAGL
ncbi:S41 family peptidase [Spirosoma rhododendri]|uniref:Peptidase S41 n=1 Tax=Spirosoma rhododendri TaxID=2728024 RepID=A0A7L5DKZ5_9BACT|nr:S41 family peptidase [Spirosoma rhododendri]QJD78202.1 peptidase S41 [Spirosoma rhododendri]